MAPCASGPPGLEFPCRFPVKAMGEAGQAFEDAVLAIVRRHAGPVAPGDVTRRASRKGRYVSLTVEITATSRRQLDDLYRELSSHERVAVVL